MRQSGQTIDWDAVVRRARGEGQFRGEAEALGLLYERYYERIYRFCLYRLFVRETAEDVVSEVFLSVARSVRGFKGESEQEFANWLFVIAANLCNAWIRQSKRRRELLDAAVRAGDLGEQECQDVYPEQTDWPGLYQALLKLDRREQSIVVLRFFENMPHDRIAEILGLKPVTVRVKLSRALRKLRKLLPNDIFGDD